MMFVSVSPFFFTYNTYSVTDGDLSAHIQGVLAFIVS